MLNQFQVLFSLPHFTWIALYIVIIIFANRIHKENSYKYGLTLLIFSIIALINNVISFIVQISDLYSLLLFQLNLPYGFVHTIMTALSWLSFGLNLASMILLVVSVVNIYKTHETSRTV